MELCAKGPKNVYTALALAIWNKAIAHEREACAKVCEILEAEDDSFYAEFSRAKDCATAIRARGDNE
jgi:hypothetical protein